MMKTLIYKITRIIAGLTLGFCTYVGMQSFFPNNSLLRFVSIFTLAPAFFFFIIFIHEMGHALAAWSLKYRVHFIAVGFIGFNPERRKFTKVEDFENNEIAGFVQYSPYWPLKGRWGNRFVAFSGPLATIVLGLIFLYFDTYFGTITETREHDGYKFLAAASFLDALFNLLPLKLGANHKSDGGVILDSFFKPAWPVATWCNTRLHSAYNYGQPLMTDCEWESFRKDILYDFETDQDVNFDPCLMNVAWAQTDPEVFVRLVELSSEDMKENIRYQYIASRILLGQYDANLNDLLSAKLVTKDAVETIDILHVFAQSLLAYAKGNQTQALETTKTARQAYIALNGIVPEEEEAIFSAIENNAPLPKLKWTRLERA